MFLRKDIVDTELEEDLKSAANGNLRFQPLCLKRRGSWDVLSGINHNFSSAVRRMLGITNVDATEVSFFLIYIATELQGTEVTSTKASLVLRSVIRQKQPNDCQHKICTHLSSISKI